MKVFSVLMFFIEAVYLGITVLFSFLLGTSYCFDVIFVFLVSGIVVSVLIGNPAIALIIALLASICFHHYRHNEIIKNTMIVITSILLAVPAFFFTKLFIKDILFCILNTVTAVGVNIYMRRKLRLDEWWG